LELWRALRYAVNKIGVWSCGLESPYGIAWHVCMSGLKQHYSRTLLTYIGGVCAHGAQSMSLSLYGVRPEQRVLATPGPYLFTQAHRATCASSMCKSAACTAFSRNRRRFHSLTCGSCLMQGSCCRRTRPRRGTREYRSLPHSSPHCQRSWMRPAP